MTEVRIEPGSAYPGDAVQVIVTGVSKAPKGTAGGTPLVFLPFGPDWRAIFGLSVDHPSGPLSVEVTKIGKTKPWSMSGTVEVLPPNFRKRELTVAKRFTSPSKKEKARTKADQAAFSEAFGREFEPWLFSEPFVRPRNSEVTAPFGDLRLVNQKKQSQHYGTDLDGAVGDPVYATNAGTVVMARDCFASGNTVLIHHGGRMFSSYFHLSKVDVDVGDTIKRGQLIGRVGKSGRVTGPHLHFGIKIDGKWVNPESVLSFAFD
jgi:murein DD-endopeptidase MepM/ murein hydrolase activator NlpD